MGMIKFLGHSAFYLEGKGIKALIDPFFPSDEAKKASEPYVGAGSGLTHIFLTHAHGDHMGNTPEIVKATGATVFAVNELATYLGGLGVSKVEGLHIGGRAKFDFGHVKMTPAFHGSSVFEAGKLIFTAEPCGFLIEVDGKKIYHAGDTGLTVEMTLLEAEGVDIALLPIGGYFTMDLDDAVRAAGMIKAKTTIPMHYDTFPMIAADPHEFAKKVGSGGKVLAIGEELHF